MHGGATDAQRFLVLLRQRLKGLEVSDRPRHPGLQAFYFPRLLVDEGIYTLSGLLLRPRVCAFIQFSDPIEDGGYGEASVYMPTAKSSKGTRTVVGVIDSSARSLSIGENVVVEVDNAGVCLVLDFKAVLLCLNERVTFMTYRVGEIPTVS